MTVQHAQHTVKIPTNVFVLAPGSQVVLVCGHVRWGLPRVVDLLPDVVDGEPSQVAMRAAHLTTIAQGTAIRPYKVNQLARFKIWRMQFKNQKPKTQRQAAERVTSRQPTDTRDAGCVADEDVAFAIDVEVAPVRGGFPGCELNELQSREANVDALV